MERRRARMLRIDLDKMGEPDAFKGVGWDLFVLALGFSLTAGALSGVTFWSPVGDIPWQALFLLGIGLLTTAIGCWALGGKVYRWTLAVVGVLMRWSGETVNLDETEDETDGDD